jgi:23S rRNA pseudouridine1911/1915/1917 synthase
VSSFSVVVPASLDGVRVDRAVALLADVSRSAVDVLVGAGRVTVDGRAVTSRSTKLAEGQTLEVDRPDEVVDPGPVGDPTVEFTVVHVDDDIVVIDKPAGLVVHPGAGHRTGTLVHGLVARYPELSALSAEVGSEPDRPGIVHRLDRGTSGLMVVARTPDAYHSLVHQLSEREVSRTGELAHPDGHLPQGQGRPHPVPGGGAVQPAGPDHAGAGLAGDGPDPPDPGPSVGHRSPGGG